MTAESQRAEIRLTADEGTQTVLPRKSVFINLGTRGTGTLVVDLRDFGFDWTRLVYSGQLQATAHVVLSDGGQYRQAESPALYFHPGFVGGVRVAMFYGEQTLLKQYCAGDFGGRVPRDLFEPEADGVSRVIYGGAGATNGGASDDEPDEASAPEELASEMTTAHRTSARSVLIFPLFTATWEINHLDWQPFWLSWFSCSWSSRAQSSCTGPMSSKTMPRSAIS